MPTPAFISITGSKQGLITEGAFTQDSVGNVYQKGHENEIQVQEIEHLIEIPADPKNGQPTGQRIHGPLTFTSTLNKASPMLYQALATGEMLTDVVVSWYRTANDGHQDVFFTTKLEDATIVSINTVLPHVQNKENAEYTQLIKVAMAYRKIIWTHDVCGTQASDDWREPKES